MIDKYTDLITLPYGLYYITDSNDYYKEFNIFDDLDQELLIDENLKENIASKEEIEEEVLIDEIENPKTGDFIYIYIFSAIISMLCVLTLTKLL